MKSILIFTVNVFYVKRRTAELWVKKSLCGCQAFGSGAQFCCINL